MHSLASFHALTFPSLQLDRSGETVPQIEGLLGPVNMWQTLSIVHPPPHEGGRTDLEYALRGRLREEIWPINDSVAVVEAEFTPHATPISAALVCSIKPS